MTEKTMTYGQAVDLVHAFIRGQDFNTVPEPFPLDRSIPTRLMYAIQQGQGDFGSAFRSGAWRDVTIDHSIWYDASTKDGKTPPAEPEAFSFDDGANLLSTLAWMVPEVGGAMSGAIGVLKAGVDNGLARGQWEATRGEGSRPQLDLFADLDRRTAAGDQAQWLRNDVTTVMGVVTLQLRPMLDRLLVNPADVASARTDTLVGDHGLTDALRTDTGDGKRHFLCEDGLGAVFALLDSPSWRRLLASGDDKDMSATLECGLQSNPTFAQLTLSVLAHAGAVIVNALWAYVYLYTLPEEAFSPGWDHKVADANGVRKRYSADAALAATRKAARLPDFPRTAWEALGRLDDLLNPAYPASNLVKRLKDVEIAWKRIQGRVFYDIGFSMGELGLRSGRWYLATTPTTSVSYDVTGAQLESSGGITSRYWCESVCKDNQVVCFDTTWLNEQGRRDQFLEPFRCAFHTHLSVDWSVNRDSNTVLDDIFSFGTTAIDDAVNVHDLNKNYGNFTYPLAPRGAHDGSDQTYPEVFWQHGGGQEAAFDPGAAGYLGATASRDYLAYLGFVLQQHLTAYPFPIDVRTGDTLVSFISGLKITFATHLNKLDKILRSPAAAMR